MVVQILTIETHPAAARGVHPGQRLEQRTLPGTAPTDERHELAGFDHQRNIVQKLLGGLLSTNDVGEVMGTDPQGRTLI